MNRRCLTLLFALLPLGLALRAAEPVDILVQGAEKLELREILAALGPSPAKVTIGPFSFWRGTIGSHRVAVSLTGQGLLNCTTATVLGIEEFQPRMIVNQGTSGAQAPYLTLHDIVVGERALDYGNFVTPVLGPRDGSRPLDWTPVPQRLRDRRAQDPCGRFPRRQRRARGRDADAQPDGSRFHRHDRIRA
jgi:adenosylhomocysteine nucleosidase